MQINLEFPRVQWNDKNTTCSDERSQDLKWEHVGLS